MQPLHISQIKGHVHPKTLKLAMPWQVVNELTRLHLSRKNTQSNNIFDC